MFTYISLNIFFTKRGRACSLLVGENKKINRTSVRSDKKGDTKTKSSTSSVFRCLHTVVVACWKRERERLKNMDMR